MINDVPTELRDGYRKAYDRTLQSHSEALAHLKVEIDVLLGVMYGDITRCALDAEDVKRMEHRKAFLRNVIEEHLTTARHDLVHAMCWLQGFKPKPEDVTP